MTVSVYRSRGTFSVLPWLDVLRLGRCVAFGWLLWTVSVDW